MVFSRLTGTCSTPITDRNPITATGLRPDAADDKTGMETMLRAALASVGLALTVGAASAQTKLVVGTVPNGGDGPLLCAMERGYFREQGIEIDLTPFKTASDMTPAMVRGDLVMMGGGVSASFFNSIAQKMPLR